MTNTEYQVNKDFPNQLKHDQVLHIDPKSWSNLVTSSATATKVKGKSWHCQCGKYRARERLAAQLIVLGALFALNGLLTTA